MKRINILLTIAIATLFVACSKPSLEDKAKVRIKPLVEKLKSDPVFVSTEVENQQTIFSGDSMCIIQYDLKIRNSYGENGTVPMEYILFYSLESGTPYGLTYSIGRDEKPLTIIVKDLYGEKVPTDKYEYEKTLRLHAMILALGRKGKIDDDVSSLK